MPFFFSATAKAMFFPSDQKQIVKVRSGLEVNVSGWNSTVTKRK